MKKAKKYLFDQADTRKDLQRFFKANKSMVNSFGSTVNQTVEAYVFAEVIKKYQENGWDVQIKNPRVKGSEVFRLKFSTRGAPNNFSYALAILGRSRVQIRHSLRVSTVSYRKKLTSDANICCDIAIIKNKKLNSFRTDDALPNSALITFAEVKHMSAYAELIASFIGLVHELMPKNLSRIRKKKWQKKNHPAPFLYVSGLLHGTAFGLKQTIENRGYDIDIFSYENPLNESSEPVPNQNGQTPSDKEIEELDTLLHWG